ncbi:50S ribosomal protein L2 [Candidatus Uhrbacteria bacterium]|nr:50S ribosomal protein L2 [Candidatus Uhrbacteria bacterium]
MAVKLYKPTSPGRRISSVADFSELTKKEPEKSLIVMKKQKSGRNNQGKITVRHRGGGVKRYIRLVDFRRTAYDVPAKVTAIEYDPNRSARLALLEYPNGSKAYIIAPLELKVGEHVLSSQQQAEIKVGNRLTLEHIPVGMMVHALELQPGQGGKLIRSAGIAARLMAVEGGHAQVKLPSGEIRVFSSKCMATIGQIGNPDHRHVRWGKAGRLRLKGWRPSVRGKAMNPVDHPHGGGEGNQPIGLKNPKTPSGRPALGLRTRKKKKYSNKFILKRRK